MHVARRKYGLKADFAQDRATSQWSGRRQGRRGDRAPGRAAPDLAHDHAIWDGIRAAQSGKCPMWHCQWRAGRPRAHTHECKQEVLADSADKNVECRRAPGGCREVHHRSAGRSALDARTHECGLSGHDARRRVPAQTGQCPHRNPAVAGKMQNRPSVHRKTGLRAGPCLIG